MPHIPRAYSPSSYTTEIRSIPKRALPSAPKTALPYRQEEPQPSQNRERTGQPIRSKLSILNFQVDPDKVFEELVGQEAEINEYTRELVSTRHRN